MQFAQPERRADGMAAIDASVDERASFLVKTYVHLAAAVFAFVLIETALFVTPAAGLLLEALMMGGRFSWLIVLGLFMVVGYVANKWAMNSTNPAMAYAGLGLYVLIEAVLFVPMIAVALTLAPEGETLGVLPAAGLTTLLIFGGLTAIVFITRKDFSFLKGILGVGMLGAMGIIVASIIFGFNLGVIFSGAMVVLAGGYVLFYTSNVLHHYRTDQHVAASLALFSALALLFWYVLRIFLASRR